MRGIGAETFHMYSRPRGPRRRGAIILATAMPVFLFPTTTVHTHTCATIFCYSGQKLIPGREEVTIPKVKILAPSTRAHDEATG